MARKKKKRGAPQKYCPSCGTSYHARAKECPSCGTAAPPSKSQRSQKKRAKKKKAAIRKSTSDTTNVRSQLRSAAAFLDSVGGDVKQARELLDTVREIRK